MKRTILLTLLSLSAYGQALDLSSLDRLIPLASEHTEVNMDPEKLKSTFGAMTSSDQWAKEVAGMTGLQVVELKFGKEGVYTSADIEPVTRQLKGNGWSKILDVKEKGESTQMYLRNSEGKGGGGFVIIAAEPKQLTVVNIAGSTNVGALGLLKSKIPEMNSSFGKPGSKKSTPATKDDE